MSRDANTKQYRRRFRINAGTIIFLILFLYLFFSIYTYITKEKTNFYEVTEGSIADDTEHTGIIIREEQAVNSNYNGYLCCLVRNGKRVSVTTPVYAIDETGNLIKYLENSSGDAILSNESISSIKKELNSFSTSFSDDSFSRTEDIRKHIDSMVADSLLYTADSYEIAAEDNNFSYTSSKAPFAGTVSFDTDGYEGRTVESITAADFNNEFYENRHASNGDLLESGSPVYRIVNSELWKIVFCLTEEEKAAFANEESIKIRLKSADISANADYSQFSGADGAPYGCLTLKKYMVDYISDRFISFDIESAKKTGLKIPKSAVVAKTFMIVPVSYLTHGGDDLSEGFYKEVYTESGSSVQYIPVTIYYSDGESYYIDISSNGALQPGDYVVMPGTSERYKLGATANLTGVYNINKGFTSFRQINVIDENDEYYIVKKNQKYGLSVYDHILFDPDGINEGDFIYQ